MLSPSGALISLLDRVFYGKAAPYAFKPAAAVVSCRRGGATASLDVLNKYFTHLPDARGFLTVLEHGTRHTPDEVRQDAEGLQIMRTLGNNMAWMIKSLAAARNTVSPARAGSPRLDEFHPLNGYSQKAPSPKLLSRTVRTVPAQSISESGH